MSNRRYAAMAAALVLCAAPAQAAIVELHVDMATTVVGYTTHGDFIHLENGFSYQNSSAYQEGNRIYLHDDGGLLETVFQSVDGHRFDVIEADIRGHSRAYRTAATPFPDTYDWEEEAAWLYDSKLSFQNFGWFGYRKGKLVAAYTSTSDSLVFSLMKFSNAFRNLDYLVARVLLPQAEYVGAPWGDPLGPGSVWCDDWCAGLQIDRLALRVRGPSTAVPLPAAVGPFLVALGGLGLYARRRRGVPRHSG